MNRRPKLAALTPNMWFDPSEICSLRLWTLILDRAERPGRELLALCRPHRLFVDVEAEARAFRQRDVSADRPQRVRAQAPAELLERQEIFGDDEIRHAGRRVHGGRQRHGRRIVVVRRNRDGLGLGRRRDVHELENPAAVRDIGVDDVDRAGAEDRTETGTRQQRFSGDHGNPAGAADIRQRLDVLRLAWLFEPIGLELRERIGEIDGVHRRQPPVRLDQNVDVRPDGIAHRARDLHGAPDVILRHVGPPRSRDGIEFQRGEAALEDALRGARIVLGLAHLVAPAVRVDADARAAGTAEEVVDRLLGDLAGDVPQRLLDARGGAIELERASPLRIIVERDLQDVADVERVAADEVAAELVDLRGDGAVAVVLAIGLAPTDDAGDFHDVFCWSMIFSENRYPLFGIML